MTLLIRQSILKLNDNIDAFLIFCLYEKFKRFYHNYQKFYQILYFVFLSSMKLFDLTLMNYLSPFICDIKNKKYMHIIHTIFDYPRFIGNPVFHTLHLSNNCFSQFYFLVVNERLSTFV